ncbi:MAG: pentapeptide repeat-containing protein [Mariprofundaceae bacterium]|nr:pentapeptide repeat-containing protein [Mariprofundaceae bacterium]
MKIKCCLVFGSLINDFKTYVSRLIKCIWHNMGVFLLSLLISLISILLLGIVTDSALETCISQFDFVKQLKKLYGDNPSSQYSFVNVVTALGASISFLIWHLRNQAMSAQTKSQYDLFNEDKQFSNYLEATKLLTDKDSTVEAKIAAMFSLADVAKAHPKHLDRIIQILNKELIPLIKAIDGREDSSKYTPVLKEKKVIKKPLALKKESELFTYTQNKIVSYAGGSQANQENIKDWQHKGNETEKIVSVALYVIRKIILELENFDSTFDFSNTIFFDIDDAFDDKSIGKKFIRKNNKRVENAIFLDCKLNNVDFKETNFHFCKFINCNLQDVDFYDANLWGTSFENCNIENIKFNKAECEGVIFKDCKNLITKQLDAMKFSNLGKLKDSDFNFSSSKIKINLKYLIIIDDDTLQKINQSSPDAKLTVDNFLTLKEYTQWKDSDKS